jgi:hypothetical protein
VTAAAADVPGPFGAAATPPAATFALTTSRQFTAWLAKQRLGLAFTTYQAGRLFLLGLRPDGRLAIFNRTFERCMGLWASPGRLFMSTLYQLWRFDNALPAGGRFEEICFCPGYAGLGTLGRLRGHRAFPAAPQPELLGPRARRGAAAAPRQAALRAAGGGPAQWCCGAFAPHPGRGA